MALQGIDNLGYQYGSYSRRLLSIIGLWPYQETSIRLPYICFAIIILSINTPLQLYVLISMESKLEQIIDVLQTFLPALCLSCCYCNLLHQFSKVRTMFDRVRYDWASLTNEQELTVMTKYANQTRLWSLGITWLCYLYASFLMCPSMISLLMYYRGLTNTTEIIIPVPKSYTSEETLRYFSMFSLQFIVISLVSTLGAANYSTLVLFLQHSRALFTVTTLKIDRPFKGNCYSSTNMRSFTSIEKEQEWIISVIKCYNEAVKFVEIIKGVFGRMYLVESFVALLCVVIDYLYILQIFTTTKSVNEMLRDCVYIAATMLVVYVYCYLGQKIIDHNTDVFVKCCQVPFYTLSLKTQKVLHMLIIKTMRPCTYSFTRMIVTSHELYANLMRMCFSYATVFYNVL